MFTADVKQQCNNNNFVKMKYESMVDYWKNPFKTMMSGHLWQAQHILFNTVLRSYGSKNRQYSNLWLVEQGPYRDLLTGQGLPRLLCVCVYAAPFFYGLDPPLSTHVVEIPLVLSLCWDPSCKAYTKSVRNNMLERALKLKKINTNTDLTVTS